MRYYAKNLVSLLWLIAALGASCRANEEKQKQEAAEHAQRRMQSIEERYQEFRRRLAENARKDHQEYQHYQEEKKRSEVAIRKSQKALQKTLEEQGAEVARAYCHFIDVRVIKGDIDELREELAEDYPEVGSALPRLIHEDIHLILGRIVKEEAELVDFDRRMAGLPPDAGTQWRPDYYNRKGATAAKALLPKLKKELNVILAERSAALANSEFTSVRQAVRALAPAEEERFQQAASVANSRTEGTTNSTRQAEEKTQAAQANTQRPSDMTKRPDTSASPDEANAPNNDGEDTAATQAGEAEGKVEAVEGKWHTGNRQLSDLLGSQDRGLVAQLLHLPSVSDETLLNALASEQRVDECLRNLASGQHLHDPRWRHSRRDVRLGVPATHSHALNAQARLTKLKLRLHQFNTAQHNIMQQTPMLVHSLASDPSKDLSQERAQAQTLINDIDRAHLARNLVP